ncbi:proline-rich protein 11 isoform X2 [Scyliorhinus canicula]|uniref:proline-rich protein 11 isoform X2 n=1 Tax=Scyliorhinus canicula TaxID=7830 RepID=UPI0018F6CAA4|nr:proline-rich protein 11 isoform X2 [Scyliorhinus canicula]
MPKLSQRHRKWKTMRKRQAMEKAWNDSRRSLLARNKRNVCKAKPIIAETAGKKKIPASISNSFQHECVPNRLTSLVNVKNMLNPLKAAISSLYNWWLNSIGQGLDVVKDILFPSRVYLRELNALRQHMEILEKELTQLHKIVDVNLASNNAKAADTCSCRKYIDFSASPAKIPVWPVQPIISRRMLLETFGALPTPAPTPPPPPPPPPPPLPPPSVFVQKPLQIQRKSRSENSLQTLSDKIGRLPSITMKDLLKVKLKKTADRFELKKINTPKKERSPLVTISDLQGFNLRAKANRLPRSAKMITTLNKPVLDLRQRLKKVAIERSPGGTPLYKENRDTGTGLTPVMTQALKRKFEMAHPKSPPCCLSPNTSFDDQIAS